MESRRITSTANATVREAARLRLKKHRQSGRRFLVEGEDLLEAALAGGFIPRQVFVLEGAAGSMDRLRRALRREGPAGAAVHVFECAPPVMDKLSGLGGGSRVVAVFDFIERRLPAAHGDLGPLPLLYLAGIGDPGNLGTIVRSASSLGCEGVLLDPRCADPFSHKATRASMGALFSLPVYPDIGTGDLVSISRRFSREIICADAREGTPSWQADLGAPLILALGSEREGIPGEVTQVAAGKVRIPHRDRSADSLNVAMAATVILYEAARQRTFA
ncbi:MAG: RNA methyltransferase [Gaiellales bacterium]|nr:MAG: RNA methyltransferase [Gaiellales bacterium]